MNEREDALKKALQKNEEESLRWQTYLKENKTAIDNMEMFAKRLTVDVMVPIGKKAFMPGHLIHTSEVLVGHYQGYFSQCTTFKAKEICELRIKQARDHIKMLGTEADFWQNKLDKPYAEGVMPSGVEREIIEDYNEETEKLWKEKHKIRVREAKIKEREERKLQFKNNIKEENTFENKTDDEIEKMLEEAELMEELEKELDKLEVDEVNDETLTKLMSGEIKLPPAKIRYGHQKKASTMKTVEESSLSSNIVKKNDIKMNAHLNTNNNVQSNPEIRDLLNFMEADEREEGEDEILPEVSIIKEQAKFLNAEDQIFFYDYQIQIKRQQIQLLPLKTEQELNEKIRLLNVLEHLEDLLEAAEETVGATELADIDSEAESENKNTENQKIDKEYHEIATNKKDSTICDKKNKSNQSRRISFALEDETLEFRKHETVTQMLPPKMETLQRDIIKRNNEDNVESKEIANRKLKSTSNKKELIQAKVEKNLQFVEENQSTQDFDLVQQILQSSMGEINTLHIKFNHSPQKGYTTDNSELLNIPDCPAYFYNLHLKKQKSIEKNNEPSTLFINSYEGEEKVKIAILKEADKQEAFVDPKSEFSNPLQAKSILKNKFDIDKENQFKDNQTESNYKIKKSNKRSNKKEENECFSAYNKVMNDVVENPMTEPEPLPDIKFIDAHTPKKRISRFKQMRQGIEKT